MSIRLFVGNLSYDVTEADLRTLFSEFGTIKMVRVPVDRETGRPRGFAFVELGEPAEATEAMNRLNQQMFMGRQLAVSEAVAREDVQRGPPRSMSMPTGAPTRAASGPGAAPQRTFGPDSLPHHKRKRPGSRAAGAESRPKAPIKESRVRAWGGSVEETEGDDVPFWAVDDGKAQETE